jgi:hypothetical protein
MMTKILVMESAKKPNFLANQSIPKYYSPSMMLHQKNFDFSKHCKYVFRIYVQDHDKPDFKTQLGLLNVFIFDIKVDIKEPGVTNPESHLWKQVRVLKKDKTKINNYMSNSKMIAIVVVNSS